MEGENAMTPPPEELLPLLEHPMATAAKAAASGATAFVLRFITVWEGGSLSYLYYSARREDPDDIKV